MAETRESAGTLAIQALAWLAGHENLLEVFLGSSGAAPGDLRAQADDPAFQAAVLDFLLMDDEWIRAFCHAQGIDPVRPAQARAALPGGDLPHWT